MLRDAITSGRAAELLGMSLRDFERLARRGELPVPPLLTGRRRWTDADLERARRALAGLAVPCDRCGAPVVPVLGCRACDEAAG